MSEDIVKQHPIIEELFASYADVLGSDMERYKNHVHRIFNYSIYLSKNTEEEKYAIAAFFHDIGIWTDRTFDYLAPSIALANQYLISVGKEVLSEEISLMIDQHHKVTSYTGIHENTVNIFRKADWTDVSMGLISFKLPKKLIQETKEEFPYLGFHVFLVKLFLKNLFQHPLKPLPMFKK